MIEGLITVLSSLIFIGYRFATLEKNIEKQSYLIREELDDRIDKVKEEVLILKSVISKEEEISALKTSRVEYTLGQDIKLVKIKINAIENFLEKKLNYNIRHLEKDTYS